MKLALILGALVGVAMTAAVVFAASSGEAPAMSAAPDPAHDMDADARCAHMPEHCEEAP